MGGKIVTDAQILGEKGVSLISRIVLEMGYIWRPTAVLDVGIDGEIEIRDPHTKQATNLIIKVQSKAFSQFPQESDSHVGYWPDQRDVEYWLGGNTPVILVISCPERNEAYWVSIHDYKDTASTAKKMSFDKSRDRFDMSSRERLAELTKGSRLGQYSPPLSKNEALLSNLLPVTTLPERIYIATTDFRERHQLIEVLKSKSQAFGVEWILKNKQILSFRDLWEHPFREVCDVGTVEDFGIQEWSDSEDGDRQREFVQLLNCALREKLRLFSVAFEPKLPFRCYYFRGNEKLEAVTFGYFGGKKETDREVFKPYFKKDGTVRYCRHSALKGQFYRFGGRWYLEVTPTYYFTINGIRRAKYYEDALKGIKRLERNLAVRGQVVMWAELLTRPGDMYRPDYPYLGFGEPLSFDLDVGLDDEAWLEREKRDQVLSANLHGPLLELL